MWFQALEFWFPLLYPSIYCTAVQGGRTYVPVFLYQFSPPRFRSSYIALQQHSSVECAPLLFRRSSQERSSCCNSKASAYYVPARASGDKTEFCSAACFDCRGKGKQESRILTKGSGQKQVCLVRLGPKIMVHTKIK